MIFYLRPPSTYLAQFILYKQPVAHIITLEINGMVKIYYLDWGKGGGHVLTAGPKYWDCPRTLGVGQKLQDPETFRSLIKKTIILEHVRNLGLKTLALCQKSELKRIKRSKNVVIKYPCDSTRKSAEI